MQYVTYWETAPGRAMPAYVALSLASLKRVLGDQLLFLTPRNTPDYIGHAYLEKDWQFSGLEFDGCSAITSIVAKSDFIRMAYVYQRGGIWLDADSIMFHDLRPSMFPDVFGDHLHWYSEVLFGAAPGHPLLGDAIAACLSQPYQQWGNPGGIRDLVADRQDMVSAISGHALDPGYSPFYCFNTCEVMFDRHLRPSDFLVNPDLKLLKLYNMYFGRSPIAQLSAAQLLDTGTLLARLFLHLEPDPRYWIKCARDIECLLTA